MAALPLPFAMSNEPRGTLHSFFQLNGNGGAIQSREDTTSSIEQPDRGLTEHTPQGSSDPKSQTRDITTERECHGPEITDSGSFNTSELSKFNDAPTTRSSQQSVNATVPGNPQDGPQQWPISSKATAPGRKRRRLNHQEKGDQAAQSSGTTSNVPPQSKPLVDGLRGLPAADRDTSDQNIKTVKGPAPTSNSTPKKMLKLNASGGLGSPTLGMRVEGDPGPRKRGRPRKNDTTVKMSLVVQMKYAGADHGSFGQRVDRILSGEEIHYIDSKQIKTPRKLRPAKSTHPFFTGNAGPRAADKPNGRTGLQHSITSISPRRTAAATPGKIRRQMLEVRSLTQGVPEPKSTSTYTSVWKEAAWPWPRIMHVRGQMSSPMSGSAHVQLRRRRHKDIAPAMDSADAVYHAFGPSAESRDQDERRLRSDGFRDPHYSVRLPRRALVTGQQLLQHVSGHLSNEFRGHRALLDLVRSIPTHTTAYDDSKGESQPWCQKYAPRHAAAVLQVGTESDYLRDWMKALTIVTAQSSGHSSLKPLDVKPRRKRRKKAEDLDDFIVSSGDESDRMSALGEAHDSISQDVRRGTADRSMAKTIMENATGNIGRNANALVLCGPPGCGKTAMVYAAAKELDFQVFEINAGGRRSGRDVLERIGDVVSNHIVSHDRSDAGNMSADEDSTRISAALQKDIESGRQGTVNSFFQTKAPSNPKPKPKVVDSLRTKASDQSKVLRKAGSARQQKQSIILFEEVDVLFEEDKAFWTTVMTLIANSRRPIVLTCSDVSLIPLEEQSLQGVLRLSHPPVELATDYLLLMAAQEGHVLAKEAVSSLYRQKRDLRSSINELQFWCQMGIGDPRGGLSWIFQRWPAGTGVDDAGNVQRVTSHDSYHAFMGLLPYERVDLSEQTREEIAAEAWSDWCLDPREEVHFAAAEAFYSASGILQDPRARLRSLRSIADLADHLSDLDIQCFTDLPICDSSSDSTHAPLGSSLRQNQLDPCQPDISSKVRLSFTESLPLLDADEVIEHSKLSRHLAIATCTLLQKSRGMEKSPERLIEHLHHRILDHQPPSFTPISSTSVYAALEPLAEPTSSSQPIHSGNYTSLIAPLSSLTEDIAPYVRSIAAYDQRLEDDRRRLHEAMHGGKEGKMRKTRAARGALEGKGRGGVRRERWWDCEIDARALDSTAPVGARRLAAAAGGDAGATGSAVASSATSVVDVDMVRDEGGEEELL